MHLNTGTLEQNFFRSAIFLVPRVAGLSKEVNSIRSMFRVLGIYNFAPMIDALLYDQILNKIENTVRKSTA